MVGAIHVYHTIAFHNLTVADWVHHVVFAGTIVPAGLVFTGGPGTNLICFFICGLPGGLDYVALTAVKHNMMHSETEKRFNARVMVWVRAPGCIYSAIAYYVSHRYGDRATSVLEGVMAIVVCVLVFMNGQYYMQQVVGNAYRKDEHMNKVGC